VDLDLTDEQKMLADTVDGLLEKKYDANARLALLASPDGWSRELWQQFASLGLLGLHFDEQYGGAGMGAGELAVVMESFGRALVLEPFVSTVLLGGSLVAAVGTPDQKAAILPGVAEGTTLLAFAHAELESRWSIADIATAATADGDPTDDSGCTLRGEKIAVLGGDSADRLIVTARTPEGSVGLFLVDGTAAGVQRSAYAMQDGMRGADIVFTDAPAERLGETNDALADIDSVLDLATAALCAEAVGAMERMLWLTVDYMKTRVQFGQPIAVFQALQHRAADMFVALDQARSLALVARLALADDDVAARRQLVRAAKIGVDIAARHVGQEAIQLHGGIGMTMEYPVGHYFKRTSVIAKTFADTDTLVERVGAAGGLIAAG
jgi:alkylation response protein AidB-like acyl-CoA dehydrogenase